VGELVTPPPPAPHVETWTQGGRAWGWQCLTCREETEPMFSSLVAAETDGAAHRCATPSPEPAVSPADELRAAAAAMTTEADRLGDFGTKPWTFQAGSGRKVGLGSIQESWEDPDTIADDVWKDDAAAIVHRQNTVARDALTLRAVARLLLDVAASIDDGEMVAGNPWAVARAFAFTGQEVTLG
jgi:hypothetical protein